MRDWIRLLIFAVIVAAIMVTLAPPGRTATEPAGAASPLTHVDDRQ